MKAMRTFFLIFILFLYNLTSFGADFLWYMGAGGEKEKPDTIFDDNIKAMADYVSRNPGLKVDLALNGGPPAGNHQVTKDIIASSFMGANSKSDFLKSDYDRLINSYKTKLENGEIKQGDQLMIYINSHGGEKDKKKKKPLSHEISTADAAVLNFNNLAGAETADLEDLKAITALAKTKGVKLAIVDQSCHSGNSLDLADDNTCVITSTGANHYGYGTFSLLFSKSMEKGKNLEQVFLEARALDVSANIPSISTEAGLMVRDQLYEKMSPYFYSFSVLDDITPFLDDTKIDNDKLTPYLRENNSELVQCVFDQNFHFLTRFFTAIDELNDVPKKVISDLNPNDKEMNELLLSYKKSLDLVRLKHRELNRERLNNQEIFNYGDKLSQSISYPWNQLLTTDFHLRIEEHKNQLDSFLVEKSTLEAARKEKREKLVELYRDLYKFDFLKKSDLLYENVVELKERLKNSVSLRPEEKEYIQAQLENQKNEDSIFQHKALFDLYTNVQNKKEEILSAHPDLTSINEKENEIKYLIESNYNTTKAIGEKERKYYSALYQMMAKDPKAANPCRDFKL